MNPNEQFGQNQYPADQNTPVPPQWPGAPVQPAAPPQQPQQQQWQTPPVAAPTQQFSVPDMSQFSSVQMAMPEAPAEAPIPQTATPPAPPSKHDHPMVVLQPGERIVAQIKRHPIGIIGNYISAGLVVVLGAAAALFLVPHVTQNADDAKQIQEAAVGLWALLAVGAAGMVAIASKIYWQNEWIITSDSITQIMQIGLFTRQSAQLSMENLEDVTVDQDGFVQHSFNFGTLHVETAGEHSKFVFPYCPNPTYYARLILEAREDFVNHKQYEEKQG